MATGIGDTLRAARRQQGRTLADAAAETRVRETYLAALEEEDFAAVGGDVYVKGFLRSYARYLGIDPNPLLDRFRSEHERPEDQAPIVQQPLPPVGPVGPMGPMGPKQRPPQAVVIGGIAVSILVVLGLIGLGSDGDQEAAAPPAPVETTTSEDLSSPDPGPGVDPSRSGEGTIANPSRPAVPSPSPSPRRTAVTEPFEELVVELTVTGGESYVRSDAGSPEIDGVFRSGYKQTFRSDERVQLRIGDAARVRLVVNGVDLGRLGDSGAVVQVTCEVGEIECENREIVPD